MNSKIGFVALALVTVCSAIACGGDDDVESGDNSSGGLGASSSGDGGGSSSGGSSSSSGGSSSGGSSGTVSLCPTAPTDYPGADAFATDGATGIALRNQLKNLNSALAARETANATGDVSVAQMQSLYTTSSAAQVPSLSAMATPTRRARVTATIDAFYAALGNSFDPEVDAASGGKFGNWLFDERGIDLRQVVEKGSFGGELYRTFADSRPITPARVDEFVALFGATPAFNASNAPTDPAIFTAKYASDRDPNGLYAEFKSNAIAAKHAAIIGADCTDELATATAEMKKLWEHALAATVVYYLNRSATQLDVDGDTDGVSTNARGLHAVGEVAGFLSGLSSLTQAERIITDAQLDDVETKLLLKGRIAPIEFANGTANASVVFPEVISLIQDAYGFTDAQIAEFKN